MQSIAVNLSEEVERLRTALQASQARLRAVADAAGTLMGKLELALDAEGGLQLVATDAMTDQLLGRQCSAFLHQPLEALFPSLRNSEILPGLHAVARQGGVLGPRSVPGERLLSGQAFNFLAFQIETGRLVVKFWDSSGAQESQEVRMLAQQQLAAIFNQSPAAISLSHVDDGTLVDVNDEWTQLTGWSFQEAIGRTTVELGFWGDLRQRELGLRTLREQGFLRNLDIQYLKRSGEKSVLHITASRIEMGGSSFILSYLKDVSAERRVQAELEASGQLLKASNTRLGQQIKLFESMESLASVGYWTAGKAPSELHWSNGLYRLAGLPVGSVLQSEDGRSRIHPDDLEAFLQARARVDGTVVEYRWHHPDGQVHWLRSRMRRWSGEAGGDIDFGVVQNITNERKAALALQEQLGFIQKITSSVPGVVFQLRRKTDGGFEFPYLSNPGREVYRGVSARELMKDVTSALHLHHPADLKGFLRTIQTSARDLTPWVHEYRLRFEDGEVRWLLGQAMPEREADGAVLWNGFVTDITERKEAEERLRYSEARFRALTELSSDWYWEQDAQFRFVRVDGNTDVSRIMPPQQYLGTTRWDSGAEGVTPAQWAAHREALEAHEVFHDFEMQRRRPDGSVMWVAISGAPIFDAQGRFAGYRGIGRDISTRRSDEDKIERLAFFDALTGMPNRRLLIDRLQNAMLFSDREGLTGALLFIDLDNFKDLNDTQGHDIGDQLLKQVAVRLDECVRDADTVARLGGDEFVVMLQSLSSDPAEAATHAENVGRKILGTLNQPYRLAGHEHHSTPSIGIALFQDSQLGIDELLKRADLAMYQAKAAGRNTWRFFDPEMQAAASARAAVEADLRQALLRDEFVLYYQPVVDENNQTTGVEALVRWKHPQRGLVLPGEFIQVAERTGLILPLGQWVLEEACRQLVEWSHQPETRGLTMAVNVSARQFRHPDFSNQILALLRQSGANPYRLKLELTESLLLTDFDDVIRKMSELRSIGVGFSLDDFGTGYSSLSYLKRLPLDQLKIDQSFVRDVLTDPNDAAIARTILALAASLDLRVVAEGVETAGQRDFLLASGCKAFQGYLFGRPMPLNLLQPHLVAQHPG